MVDDNAQHLAGLRCQAVAIWKDIVEDCGQIAPLGVRFSIRGCSCSVRRHFVSGRECVSVSVSESVSLFVVYVVVGVRICKGWDMNCSDFVYWGKEGVRAQIMKSVAVWNECIA